MANTRLYSFPPRSPSPVLRWPEDFDRDYLEHVAATVDSYTLAGNRDHIEAICALVGTLSLELLNARDQLQSLTIDLESARTELALAKSAGTAVAARADDLTATMNRISARLGKTMAEAEVDFEDDDEQALEDAAEDYRFRRVALGYLARSRAVTRPIAHRATVGIPYSRSMLWDVSPKDVVDEPEPGRCQTQRLARGSQVAEAYADSGADERTVVVSVEVVR